MRHQGWRTLALVVVAAFSGTACRENGPDASAPSEDTTVRADTALLAGVILSKPVAMPAFASALRVFASAQTGFVTYVALVPGTVPDGVEATVANSRAGETRITHLQAGGFDPIAVSAVA